MTDQTTDTPEADAPEARNATDQTTETFDRKYVEKLRKEAAQYRTQLREREEALEQQRKEAERAKLDETERLKAELEEALAAKAAASEAAQRAAWQAELTGRVADPKAALRLLDDDLIDEDGINLERLLDRYPFLAPAGSTAPRAVPSMNSGSSKDHPLQTSDFKGKDPEWVRENLHRIERPKAPRRL